jgi:hypothetical protein
MPNKKTPQDVENESNAASWFAGYREGLQGHSPAVLNLDEIRDRGIDCGLDEFARKRECCLY